MKKTKKTALTAAALTASFTLSGCVPPHNVYGPPVAYETETSEDASLTDPVAETEDTKAAYESEDVQEVYGPPVDFENGLPEIVYGPPVDIEDEEEYAASEDMELNSQSEIEVVYGPAPAIPED